MAKQKLPKTLKKPVIRKSTVPLQHRTVDKSPKYSAEDLETLIKRVINEKSLSTPLAASIINDLPETLPTPQPPSQTVLLEPDPFHPDPRFGFLFIQAAHRILSFARTYPSEIDPEKFAQTILARLCMKDPDAKCLLVLDEGGEVVGHILATIEHGFDKSWLFCWQAQNDQPHSGVLHRALEIGEAWAKSRGATFILMATQIDPDFWKKRYGFESLRSVMSKPIA